MVLTDTTRTTLNLFPLGARVSHWVDASLLGTVVDHHHYTTPGLRRALVGVQWDGWEKGWWQDAADLRDPQ